MSSASPSIPQLNIIAANFKEDGFFLYLWCELFFPRDGLNLSPPQILGICFFGLACARNTELCSRVMPIFIVFLALVFALPVSFFAVFALFCILCLPYMLVIEYDRRSLLFSILLDVYYLTEYMLPALMYNYFSNVSE